MQLLKMKLKIIAVVIVTTLLLIAHHFFLLCHFKCNLFYFIINFIIFIFYHLLHRYVYYLKSRIDVFITSKFVGR